MYGKPWVKVMVSIMLSFMILFTSIGYAALTTNLSVTGVVDIAIPSGLFITDVKVKDGSTANVEHQDVSFIRFSTTVDSVIDKKDDTWTQRPNGRWQTTTYEGSITYVITVFNNTEYEYAYRGLYYQKNEYNNSYVNTTASDSKIGVVTNFKNGSVVAPGASLEFEVTYTIGEGIDDLKVFDRKEFVGSLFSKDDIV